jgi:hypothetical protein
MKDPLTITKIVRKDKAIELTVCGSSLYGNGVAERHIIVHYKRARRLAIHLLMLTEEIEHGEYKQPQQRERY